MMEKILKLLPGGDCAGFGGCGKTTCQACAEAIAAGESVALCPACKQETVDAIAEIMEVPTVETKDEIAYVFCAGRAAGKENG
jgi:Na+-translocating ferredoxin:NAD+ oxidoreductase RNF subunit RnfB